MKIKIIEFSCKLFKKRWSNISIEIFSVKMVIFSIDHSNLKLFLFYIKRSYKDQFLLKMTINRVFSHNSINKICSSWIMILAIINLILLYTCFDYLFKMVIEYSSILLFINSIFFVQMMKPYHLCSWFSLPTCNFKKKSSWSLYDKITRNLQMYIH